MILGRWTLARSMLVLSLLAGAGCSTTVHVNSNPPGADVYAKGKGRAAYQWQHKGQTPVTYTSRHETELTRVRWPDAGYSPVQESALLFEDEVTLNFDQTKAPAARRP